MWFMAVILLLFLFWPLKIDGSRLVLIILHYGEAWPSLYPAFLAGASMNGDVDFVIVRNLEKLPVELDNVKLVSLPLSGLNALLSEKLHRDPAMALTYKTAYKLVDFKTMFGFLFPDVVKGYDFWGHIDADTLPSRIISPNFLRPEMLDNHDVISGTNGMCNGPFQLYRNRADINTLFKLSPDLPGVVNSTASKGFTESHGEMRIPFPILIKRQVIKHKFTWNRTMHTYLEDRLYHRQGAQRGYIWSPKFNLRLRWTDLGIFPERITDDRKTAIPLMRHPVPGFFHLISWKYLKGFRGPMSRDVVDNLRRKTSRFVYVSCHGFHAVDDAVNNPSQRDEVEKASLAPCDFPRNEEVFYRPGRQAACLGGVDAYDQMLKFAARAGRVR